MIFVAIFCNWASSCFSQFEKSSDFVIEVTWYLTFDLKLYLFQKQASYLGWYLREV